ncbi:MAG: threonine synthase [Gammaproteobacteria bacterium]|nr:MAG: threonine synthase [Gammaproteobacteria bacterium]
MSYVKNLRCTACATEYPADQLINLCPLDSRPLELIIDIERIKAEKPNFSWYRPEIKSLWRFGSLLGLDINDQQDKTNIVSLGEGHTPEIHLQSHSLAKKHNFSLFLKDEGQPHAGWGANPTGSFKDRGMTMAISMAKHFAVTRVVVPTQGNAGDSLAEYAMKAGMEAVVIMPDDTPMPILGRVSALAKMRDDVTIELVQGTIREAAALMKEKYLPQGYFNMATFQEPGWRIDGKKTLGFELAEPSDGITDAWVLPDVILYPTGGGTGILGMWKAFDEMQALGLIDSRRPKVISVQAENTAPVVTAYDKGEADSTVVEAGETLAVGLNVPGGVGHFKVLDIIRQSGGMAIAVDEQSIGQNLTEIYNDYGIWICPEGAATIAALTPAIERGLIKSGDKVVAFNTGSFEKYLPIVRHLIF